MLKVKNLKLLNGKVINLEVNPGEILFIKGANGAGKSLFLKSLARLIPSSWDELSFNNKSMTHYPIEMWRSKITYLPPEVCFSDESSVDEYLAEPFLLKRYKNFKTKFEPQKNLTNLAGTMKLLSSGQRQRIALLRAMSLDSDILLLDESFGHMDQATREEFFNLLAKWVEKGKILLIVSHFEIGMRNLKTSEFII